VIALAGNRQHWLFFCAGVEHAYNIRDILKSSGIHAETVTGKTPKNERERILDDFKQGKIKALTNANILTTGFDYPDVDLIAMLRPTMSPGLYVQMAGRGLRPKTHTNHCLVLDFAGVVEQHGPITAINPPSKKGDEKGEAPVKMCEQCGALVHAAARSCRSALDDGTYCFYRFPEPEKKKMELHDNDIMGREKGKTFDVSEWKWEVYRGSKGMEMLIVKYYETIFSRPETEYIVLGYPGEAGAKATRRMLRILELAGAYVTDVFNGKNLQDIADNMNKIKPPKQITIQKSGNFITVLKMEFAA
jgi:DNA repair protein RadD